MVTTHNQQLEDFLANVERRAFRIAEMSTRNREDALDIVQDAMLQLVKKYAHKPAQQWTPLFYRILNNRLMDQHRKNTVQSRWRVWLTINSEGDEITDPIQELSAEENTHEAILDIQHSVEKVDVAIQQLSIRQRQAFLYRAWEGMDIAETARAMQCSQGSVKTHYSRAIKFLRAHLQS